MCACVTGAWMTYLPGALQVPLSLLIAGAIVPAAVGSSSSGGGGAEPPSKRARPWSFLPSSTQYVCGAEICGMSFPLPAFQIPGFEGSVWSNDRSCTILVPVVRWEPTVSVALATEVLGASGTTRVIVGTEMPGASVPKTAARGVWLQPPGPQVPCVQSCPDCICLVFLTLHPRHQLEVGGEQSRAGVLIGHHYGAVAPPDTSLGPPQHSLPGPGWSGKEKQKNSSRIPNGFICAYLLFRVLFPQLLS
jgi:hypothetical protein